MTHARRDRADLRLRDRPRLRPGGTLGDRGDHGRPDLGGVRIDHAVLLEVATWNGVNILRTSRKLGLRSDASTRFEKQLHPELAIRAQRIASRLLVEIAGARLVPGTIDVDAEIPPPHRIGLRADRAERILGMRVEPGLGAEYLRRLEFEVDDGGDELEATVPVHRHYDVTREADLIEEVGRIHGYADHMPSTLPEATGQTGGLTREQTLRRRAEDVVRDLGFDAVVTLSLTDPEAPSRLRIPDADVRARPIRVTNPLSRDHSVLRTTLLGSLLDAARHNLAHGADRVALYESGRTYLPEGSDPSGDRSYLPEGSDPSGDRSGVLAGQFAGERPAPAYEPSRIGALAVGPLVAGGWRGEVEAADFFTLKGALEGLAAQLGCELAVVDGCGAVPASGARGRDPGRRRAGGVDRRGPSARLPRMGHRARGGIRGRPRAARRRLPVRRGVRTRT